MLLYIIFILSRIANNLHVMADIMEPALQIDKMTIAEKLRIMELLWDDLCRTPEQIPSPDWHEEVLRAREERITQGNAEFTDWTEAKEKIRTAVK